MKKKLNIGLVGYGFMGRTHTNGYKRANDFFELEHRPVLQAACGRDVAKTKAFADQWGWQSVESDWRRLVERDDIDAIDICTPNDSHAEIALECIKHGKMILCEKPLALNGEQGEKMVAAVEKSGLPNLVWYNYRFLPAVTLAKNIVAAELADECEVQLSYAIGVPEPLSIYANCDGTEKCDLAKLEKRLGEIMDLRPRGIRTHLGLNKPIYRKTAAYGHFGRKPEGDFFPWERTDLVNDLKAALA